MLQPLSNALKYILWPLAILLALRFVKFVIKYRRNNTFLSKIPSPPQYFLLGNLPFILSDPDLIFDKLRECSTKYYPIYRFATFYVTIVNLLQPSDIEIVLSSTKHLTKSKIYTFLNQWLGTGLLTSTGEKWHQRRKILTPAFHFSILQQFLTVFNDETQTLVKRLSPHCGETVCIIPHITHFTLQSITETAMGLSNTDDKSQREYREAVNTMGKIILKRLSTPWYRFQKLYEFSSLGKVETKTVKILHDFSNNIITQRQKDLSRISDISGALGNYSTSSDKKKKRLAMLDLLIEAKKSGAQIDHEGIREEVDTFMFEGHDTTSMAISFILLCLANNPEIQDKVYEEIKSIVGHDQIPNSNDLSQMKLTERCIKESLRLFPSVPLISRFASEEFVTKTGFTIPKDTILHIHIFDLHRCAHIYPDPLKFDPDRFLPEVAKLRHPFAYLPFSAGPRNCIGQKFAVMELKAVLCGILRNFILEPVDRIHDIKFKPDLVLRPTTDIRIKILER